MKKKTTQPKQPKRTHLSQCFLEHAARETVWMREHAKNCRYAEAATCEIRRGVWMHAALLAQEAKK